MKDLLLNSEWNANKNRANHLHRHPCFIGNAESIMHGCCKTCPEPNTEEEIVAAEEDSKIYVQGDLEFMKDNSGRQAIGSFNPLTADDWTDMADLGGTEELCQAIADRELAFVQKWCQSSDNDVNHRDHTGRTPLHLAVQTSTPEIVNCLIDSGARIIARVADGTTALHMAAARGNTAMVQALLEKSEANEQTEEETKKKGCARAEEAHREAQDSPQTLSIQEPAENSDSESDTEMVDAEEDESDSDSMSMTQGSFMKIKPEEPQGEGYLVEEDREPDIYTTDLLAWDLTVSPLHLAILFARITVIEMLVDRFGADVLLPIKLPSPHNPKLNRVILTLVLAAVHPGDDAVRICETLLERGTSAAQSDTQQISAYHYIIALQRVDILKAFLSHDGPSAQAVLNHVAVSQFSRYASAINTPLFSAIQSKNETLIKELLEANVDPNISCEKFAKELITVKSCDWNKDIIERRFQQSYPQPVIEAIRHDLCDSVELLLTDASPEGLNILTTEGCAIL